MVESDPGSTSDDRSRQRRSRGDAILGIAIAIVASAILWPLIIGLYYHFFH